MQSLSAGGFDKRAQTKSRQAIAHIVRGSMQSFPSQRRIGIKVECQTIRLLDMALAGAPGMNFQHADLDQRDQSRQRIDHQAIFHRFAFANSQPANLRGDSIIGVALVETLLSVPFRAANQCQRSAADMRQDPIGYFFIVLGQFVLGNSLLRIKHPIRMAELHAGDLVRFSF